MRKLYLFLFLLALALTGCSSATPAPTATATATVAFTSTPLPSLTPTWTPSPTMAPTATPTLGPYGEIEVSPSLALTYARAEWEEVPAEAAGGAMIELRHQDFECSLRFYDLATEAMGAKPTQIGGFSFLVLQGPNVETWIGPQIPGLEPMIVDISSASALGRCKQAARALLRTLRLSERQQQRCKTGAFEKGMQVHTVDYVYLRSEPRWAEDTRLNQVPPNTKMEIIGGPTCAMYNKGVYVYWQVRLENGKEAWIAEGDAQGAYIQP